MHGRREERENQGMVWRLHLRTPKDGQDQTGTKHANKSTSNMCVEEEIAMQKIVHIVFVVQVFGYVHHVL